MATEPRRRKFWGWGYEGEGVTAEEREMLAAFYAERFGADDFGDPAPPREDEFDLAKPRITPPTALEAICTSDPHERLVHAYGKSFADAVRVFARHVPPAPDVIVYPENETDVAAVLDWADGAGAAVIPFGGGSSVVGGIEPRVGDGYKGTISLDLGKLDQVLEIDTTSRAARIQAGIMGPALEGRLKQEGLTLRHFPQSFEYSTLGGWIATRSGGHYASLYTHIDDFVESLRTVTPAGVMESRRLPGSGAGPSPDRMMIGSEGALGVITEAWMRLQDRPSFRASASVRYKGFKAATEAVRALSQSWLFPTNCRLLDAGEAQLNGAGDGSVHILVLGFESADHPVEPWMARALELAADHGGVWDTPGEAGDSHKAGVVGAWRNAFIRMPYFREASIGWGVIADTFETAITWDRFDEFHAGVMARVHQAIADATGAPGIVTCRFTHIYPDGPAPYYSFRAMGDRTRLLDQWSEIKTAASDVVVDLGGTITHHHAVGRDHQPWYDRQRPALFGAALKAAKGALDPNGIMNPGVVVGLS
jgi:alkyldihydroxyacetonephosphate synthase